MVATEFEERDGEMDVFMFPEGHVSVYISCDEFGKRKAKNLDIDSKITGP